MSKSELDKREKKNMNKIVNKNHFKNTTCVKPRITAQLCFTWFNPAI